MTDTLHEAARGLPRTPEASEGKKERTLYTYGKDLEQIEAFFGTEPEAHGHPGAARGQVLPLRRAPQTPEREGTLPAYGREDQAGASHVPGLGPRDGPDRQAAPAQGYRHGPEREERRKAVVSYDKRRNQRPSRSRLSLRLSSRRSRPSAEGSPPRGVPRAPSARTCGTCGG